MRERVKLADGSIVEGEAVLDNVLAETAAAPPVAPPPVDLDPQPEPPQPDATLSLADNRARLLAWKQVAHDWAHRQPHNDRNHEDRLRRGIDTTYNALSSALNAAHDLVPLPASTR